MLPIFNVLMCSKVYLRISRVYRLLPVVLSLLMVGCASGPALHVTSLSKLKFASVSQVQTLYHAPQSPYVVIAKIHGEAPVGTSPAQVVAAMLVKAGSLGANALILYNHSRVVPPLVQYSPSGGNYQNQSAQSFPVYEGIAIHMQMGSK